MCLQSHLLSLLPTVYFAIFLALKCHFTKKQSGYLPHWWYFLIKLDSKDVFLYNNKALETWKNIFYFFLYVGTCYNSFGPPFKMPLFFFPLVLLLLAFALIRFEELLPSTVNCLICSSIICNLSYMLIWQTRETLDPDAQNNAGLRSAAERNLSNSWSFAALLICIPAPSLC